MSSLGDLAWSSTAMVALVVALPLLVAPLPSWASDDGRDAPVDVGVFSGSVRFQASPGTTFELGDGRRFVDSVELRVADGQPVLVNELPLDDYVAGVAEMPSHWPREALEAQAVAARTYAWWQLRRESFTGYDICATVACQVFVGAERVESRVGQRWQRAVDETSGQVLIDGAGAPILARYFSTSGGRTFDNAEVFPDTGARRYLQGVDDPDDAISPLHRWQVRFPRARFDRVLERGETLRDATPVADVERVRRRGGKPDRIRVTATDGTRASVTAGEFREFVSSVAAERYPGAYPSLRADGEGRLPDVLPSSRFEVTVEDDEVLVDGRGWGHGVGMGQYGAKGKAERGLGHEEILAAYYNGLTPSVSNALPGQIRVGLPLGEETTVRADGPFRVFAGGERMTRRGLGAWTVRDRGDGTVALRGPPGFGKKLVVAPTSSSAQRFAPGSAATLETVVSKTAELALWVTDSEGERILRRDLGVADPGPARTSWTLDDRDGEPVSPGRYRVALVATDEDGETAGRPAHVEVVDPPPTASTAPAVLTEPRGGPKLALLPLAIMGTALVGLLALTATRGRRR